MYRCGSEALVDMVPPEPFAVWNFAIAREGPGAVYSDAERAEGEEGDLGRDEAEEEGEAPVGGVDVQIQDLSSGERAARHHCRGFSLLGKLDGWKEELEEVPGRRDVRRWRD